ncbi:hypothetical protein BDN72DRAFT_672147 [Pluteus cervinus]|uniref:Uncharacterized protein n=1 Tax=Pluteus cervinus TaxID=181527 RepID=A0ACD3BAP7_9AGAR|nr:hypothetical protein BDN72DRAFT_672147 [Pluteus cervinus]
MVMSNEYHVKEWLVPGLNELAKRAAPISFEKGSKIGFDIALKLAAIRGKRRTDSRCTSTTWARPGSTSSRSGRHLPVSFNEKFQPPPFAGFQPLSQPEYICNSSKASRYEFPRFHYEDP